MITDKLSLVNEQTSPLFRIMWVSNVDDISKRHFDNNISAFHAGNGLILSVAHNLRMENTMLKSIDDKIYNELILSKSNAAQVQIFNQAYIKDENSGKRLLQQANTGLLQTLNETFRQIGFDTRWLTLTKNKITAPFLIIQFNNSLFYNNSKISNTFNKANYFHEPSLNRQTFLLELELIESFYGDDIAAYRLVNNDADLLKCIPSLELDYSILDDNNQELYCLQSSPGGSLGRLLNKASVEGYIDHHNVFHDRIGGNYILEGYRYLIRGYFRFGSSGAPYIYYDPATGKFKVNAIQSEASPVQLSINNNREGNYQYVNAIASPLHIIEDKLKSIHKNLA